MWLEQSSSNGDLSHFKPQLYVILTVTTLPSQFSCEPVISMLFSLPSDFWKMTRRLRSSTCVIQIGTSSKPSLNLRRACCFATKAEQRNRSVNQTIICPCGPQHDHMCTTFKNRTHSCAVKLQPLRFELLDFFGP